MNVKSCEIEKNSATLVMEFSKEAFSAGLEKAYQKARKDIYIPGFRKGKAPRKVIEGMYGAEVFYEDAVNLMFPAAYADAVSEKELKVVGDPSVTALDKTEEGGVSLTVITALYPEVTLGDYKGLEVEKVEATVTDEEVDAEIDRMAQRNARIVTVERPAQNGDTAVIDFEGFDNGVPFEGGKGEKYSLTLGSGSFVPGFEEQVVGMSAGEEKEINITFPENYTPELAGKPVVFKVKVHEVKETILPEKDDEFVKDVSEFDTMDELKADIRKNIQERKDTEINNAFESACIQNAASNATVDVPECMVDEQLDKVMQQYAYQIQMSGMKIEDYAKMMGTDLAGMRQSMRPMAAAQVKDDVVLGAIVKAENIEVTDEEVEAEYQKLADQYKMELDKVKAAVSVNDMKTDMLYKKATKLVVDSAVPVAPKPAEEKAEEAPKAKKTTKKTTKKAAQEPEAAESEKTE